ncbi:MAG: oligosaccharide flippase family protein [Anaerotruncus sp.]|nr:oligosaccharide flippase family protein [Anaerotruncus sp.]
MDKYSKLLSNTVIFAIGTFSSKLLVFLLVPFYTRVLTTEQLGTGDLIVNAANLLIPVVSAGMANAIIRYGLDKSVRKSDVFTSGILVIFSGYLLFLLFRPLLDMIPILHQHTLLIYIYVLTSCLRSLCAQFVRARELVRLYAFDGILSTATVILFNILFLLVFKLGILGYVLATICSDALSALFLFWIARLHRYLRLNRLDWSILGGMLRFSLPLIPTNMFWWITNVSDRYLVAWMINEGANGLYAMSYKIPTMIILVSGIFTDAWQMSAITENNRQRNQFYSTVFSAYQAIIFTAASGLILCTKLISKILFSKEFYSAWQYVPFLLIATSFSCFVTFLGSIYMVEKKSMATLITTVAGAVCNVLLNLLLIPEYGINGAAFATFISYLLVFLLRAIDTHRYVNIHWSAFKLLLNLVILLVQAFLLITQEEKWILPEILLCLVVVVLNLNQLLLNVQKIFRKVLK